jgi:hypothetical protein
MKQSLQSKVLTRLEAIAAKYQFEVVTLSGPGVNVGTWLIQVPASFQTVLSLTYNFQDESITFSWRRGEITKWSAIGEADKQSVYLARGQWEQGLTLFLTRFTNMVKECAEDLCYPHLEGN